MISLLCPVIMLLHQQKIHKILQGGEEVFLTRISCLPLSAFGGKNKRVMFEGKVVLKNIVLKD